MRFGKTLKQSIYSPWRDNYIDYAKLKKLLREDESALASPSTATKDVWTEEDEGAFVDELVNVQLEKVHAFHKETYEQLRERTASCEAQLDDVAVADVQAHDGTTAASGNGKRPVPSEQEKQRIMNDVLKELDNITKETNELAKYARINYTGFLKAVKKHDRKRGDSYRVRPLLQVRLSALPFNKEDYSPLLYRLSAMYSFIRQHMDGGDKIRGLSMSEPQEAKEEYTAHKFWVHPDNLLEVKTIILRRLPVLVYNPQTSKIAQGSQPDPSITSIYFDNPSFALYTRKVDDGEASSLRLRWYGQLESKPPILVEKKTVTEEQRSKEGRFTIKEKYVQRYIKNEYHMEKQIKRVEDRAGADSTEAKNLKANVEEIQEFIKENDLQPVLRANYTRTAFQIPGDDRVRISLDTNLAFIREDAIDTDRPCRDPDSWHRTDIDGPPLEYPFSSIRKGEISRFPFALLEVKIKTESKRSEWIQDLMNSHLVKDAPRFSKFAHGVSMLFEDYVNTFPFWLSEMEADIRRDPHQAFEEEQAKRRKEVEDEVAVGSLIRSTTSMSPMVQGKKSPRGVISPVGSPSTAAQQSKSPRFASRKTSQLGTSVRSTAAAAPEQDNIAEEPDDDETGEHTHTATRDYGTLTSASGLKSVFTSAFSTSKYAEHKRRGKLPPGVEEPSFWIKDQGPVKVEAKVWLANQRTFVKWQHVSVLLASLSLGLYNAAGKDNNVARSLAIVYTVVAVFTALWGYGVYMWRSSLIQRRSGKDFDAVAGPVIVCIGLTVALILNFTFKVSFGLRTLDDMWSEC
jgi:SPX domain protein involved in polyphosphate accumulation/uncharacterized membrane protein YidH (DUF202 family)